MVNYCYNKCVYLFQAHNIVIYFETVFFITNLLLKSSMLLCHILDMG